MPQHVLPVLCKQSKRRHEDIIAQNPEAIFCPFCSHELQPSPIIITSSPSPSTRTTRFPSAQQITVYGSQRTSHPSSSAQERDKGSLFLPMIQKNAKEATRVLRQSAQNMTQSDMSASGVNIKLLAFIAWKQDIDGFEFFLRGKMYRTNCSPSIQRI
jgi:hypothetical protein